MSDPQEAKRDNWAVHSTTETEHSDAEIETTAEQLRKVKQDDGLQGESIMKKSSEGDFRNAKLNLQSDQNLSNISLQFCSDDDDGEVFFGDLTKKEQRKASKFNHRSTAVFKDDFRRDVNLMRHTFARLQLTPDKMNGYHSANGCGDMSESQGRSPHQSGFLVAQDWMPLGESMDADTAHVYCTEACTDESLDVSCDSLEFYEKLEEEVLRGENAAPTCPSGDAKSESLTPGRDTKGFLGVDSTPNRGSADAASSGSVTSGGDSPGNFSSDPSSSGSDTSGVGGSPGNSSSDALASDDVSSDATSSDAASSDAASSDSASSDAASSDAASSDAASSDAASSDAASSDAASSDAASSDAASSDAASSDAASSDAVSSDAVSSDAVSSGSVTSATNSPGNSSSDSASAGNSVLDMTRDSLERSELIACQGLLSLGTSRASQSSADLNFTMDSLAERSREEDPSSPMHSVDVQTVTESDPSSGCTLGQDGADMTADSLSGVFNSSDMESSGTDLSNGILPVSGLSHGIVPDPAPTTNYPEFPGPTGESPTFVPDQTSVMRAPHGRSPDEEQAVPEAPALDDEGEEGDQDHPSFMSPMAEGCCWPSPGMAALGGGHPGRDAHENSPTEVDLVYSHADVPDVSILTLADTTTAGEAFDLSGGLFDPSVANTPPPHRGSLSGPSIRIGASPLCVVPDIGVDRMESLGVAGSPGDVLDSGAAYSTVDAGYHDGDEVSVTPQRSQISEGISPPGQSQLPANYSIERLVFKEKEFSPTMNVIVSQPEVVPPLVALAPPPQDTSDPSVPGCSGSGDHVPDRGEAVRAPPRTPTSSALKRSHIGALRPRPTPTSARKSPHSSVFERLYAYRKVPGSNVGTPNAKSTGGVSPNPATRHTLKLKLSTTKASPSKTLASPTKTIGSPVSKQFTPAGVKKNPKSTSKPASPVKSSAKTLFNWPAPNPPWSSPAGKTTTGDTARKLFKRVPGTGSGMKITTTGSLNRAAVTNEIGARSAGLKSPALKSPARALPVFRDGTPRRMSGSRRLQTSPMSRRTQKEGENRPPIPNFSSADSSDEEDSAFLDDSVLLQEKKSQLEQLKVRKVNLQKKIARKVATGSEDWGSPPVKKSPLHSTTADNLPKVRFKGTQALNLNEQELHAITLVNTLCNSQQAVKLVTKAKVNNAGRMHPQVVKESSKLKWNEDLVAEVEEHHSPTPSPTLRRRSIIKVRPPQHEFPYGRESPQPIVVRKGTRRSPKGLQFACTEV